VCRFNRYQRHETTAAFAGKLQVRMSRRRQHWRALPVELARAANGYIDSTAPFKLAKDPAQAARLDTVLNLSTQAVYQALSAIADSARKSQGRIGPARCGIEGKTLADLLDKPSGGHKLGTGQVLFPKVEVSV